MGYGYKPHTNQQLYKNKEERLGQTQRDLRSPMDTPFNTGYYLYTNNHIRELWFYIVKHSFTKSASFSLCAILLTILLTWTQFATILLAPNQKPTPNHPPTMTALPDTEGDIRITDLVETDPNTGLEVINLCSLTDDAERHQHPEQKTDNDGIGNDDAADLHLNNAHLSNFDLDAADRVEGAHVK